MRHDEHLVAEPWEDYELLDSGAGVKLERFGEICLARPETQALWEKRQPTLPLWSDPHAVFTPGEKGGAWAVRKEVPDSWRVARGPLTFFARLTSFKHVGIFPEQEPNWFWVRDRVKALGAPSVLNLFGYTGVATLAAAHAGAKVTHVDASKQSLDWARENARATELAPDAIRWIADDALAFAKREVRRDARYDGIILDPPAFGRGTKGEVWHIERDLPALLAACASLLAKTPGAFFLVNGYAAGYASRAFAEALTSAFSDLPSSAESGELHIREKDSERVIPSGIYCRFVR